MDPIAKFLNLTPIENIDLSVEYGNTPLKGVPCFSGWQKGEMTEEHRKNLSIAASNRIRTPSHLDKLHEGRRNSINSTDHKEALIKSRLGSKHTSESKELMRAKRLANSNRLELASKAGKISAKKRALDPDYKKRQSEKMKEIWKVRKGGIVNGD